MSGLDLLYGDVDAMVDRALAGKVTGFGSIEEIARTRGVELELWLRVQQVIKRLIWTHRAHADQLARSRRRGHGPGPARARARAAYWYDVGLTHQRSLAADDRGEFWS